MTHDLFGYPRRQDSRRTPVTLHEAYGSVDARLETIIELIELDPENEPAIRLATRALEKPLKILDRHVSHKACNGVCPRRLSRTLDGIKGVWRSLDIILHEPNPKFWENWGKEDFLNSRVLLADCRAL